MKKINKTLLSFLMMTLVVIQASAQNQVEMADTMRAEGKIYVVVGIILMVLAGLIVYLFLMDRKVKKLEARLAEKQR